MEEIDNIVSYDMELYDDAVPSGNVNSNAPKDVQEWRGLTEDEIKNLSSTLTAFDARNYDVVPFIKNQGSDPICWAYGSTAALEISMLKEGFDQEKNKDNLNFSERNAAYRVVNKTTNPLPGTTPETFVSDHWSTGRIVQSLTNLYSQWRGPVQFSETGGKTDYTGDDFTHYLMEKMVRLPALQKNDLEGRRQFKEFILKYGAVSGAYHYFPGDIIYYNADGSKEMEHQVAIIGWDDTIPAESFSTKASTDGAWLVRNSWGASFHKNGYFWLSYDSYIKDCIVYDMGPMIYDYNYYYDTDVTAYSAFKNRQSYVYVGNIYKAVMGSASQQEVLKAANISVFGRNTEVEISVYKNLENINQYDIYDEANIPVQGEPVSVTKRNFIYQGDYTIELDTPVVLNRGEYFSIVVKVTNPENNASIFYSKEPESSNNDLSYYYVESTGKWVSTKIDEGVNAVARIKGYTVMEDREESLEEHLRNANIIISGSNFQYDGELKTPDVSVTYDGVKLQKDKDYVLAYTNNRRPGTASVYVIGLGRFEGQVVENNFLIQKSDYPYGGDPHDATIHNLFRDEAQYLKDLPLPYGWEYIDPNKEISSFEAGKETAVEIQYIADDKDNYNIITARAYVTVYEGTRERIEYELTEESLNNVSFIYTGEPARPKAKLSIIENGNLKYEATQGYDYIINYENNINPGTATAIIKGIKGRKGEFRLDFEILPNEKKDISNASLEYQKENNEYIFEPVIPNVNVYYEGGLLTKNEDYVIGYTDNEKEGRGKFVLIGINEYEGVVNGDFGIVSAQEVSTDTKPPVETETEGEIETPVIPDGEDIPDNKELEYDEKDEEGDESELDTSHKVKFDLNGVEGIISDNSYMEFISYTQDSKVTKPENPIASGYEFLGWYKEKDGITPWNFETDTFSSDIVLYAKWKNKYVVEEPSASIDNGKQVEKGSRLNLTSATNGATIYYTTDSNLKDFANIETWKLYEEAIELNEETSLWTFAVKQGYDSSDIVELHYTVKDNLQEWKGIGELAEELQKEGIEDVSDIPAGLWVSGVSDVDYTGQDVTFPNMKVFNNKILLEENKDYTVKYANNKKAGTASVTITGKGNYSGSIKKNFQIKQLDLGDVVIKTNTEGKVEIESGNNNTALTIQDITTPYNKKVQKGTTTVTYEIDGKDVTIKAGTDFTYIYPHTNTKEKEGENVYDASAFKETGEYIVTITGKGNYSGTAQFKETIAESPKLISKLTFGKLSNVVANTDGSELKPEVVITEGKGATAKTLTKDTDYTLEYQNNTLPGTATIIVRGMGEYSGYKVLTFKITSIPMSKAVLSGTLAAQDYTGEDTGASTRQEGGYVLTYTAKKGEAPETLEEGRDYTVTYTNSVNAGKNKATVVFTGKNRFAGTLKKAYTINAHTIADNDVTVEAEAVYRKGKTIPEITVKFGNTVLKEKTDYTVTVSNNTAVNDGTNPKKVPTVTIKGKGNFAGTVKKTFKIKGSSLDNVSMESTDITYQNKAGTCKPKLTLTDVNGSKLAAGTDYNKTITYTYNRDVVVENVVNKKRVIVYRAEGENVDLKNDIIPVGAEIKAEVTGMKNYAGSGETPSKKSVIFRYVTADLAKATVKIPAQYYTGRSIELFKDNITITLSKKPLEKTDYEIAGYTNNVSKGTATVTLRGLGNYGGTKAVKFTISNKSMLYTIEYDSNNDYMTEHETEAPLATGTMKKGNVSAGGKLAANAYKRKGYVFTGWNTQPDGKGESYTNKEVFELKDLGAYPVSSYGTVIKLYAQWEKQ